MMRGISAPLLIILVVAALVVVGLLLRGRNPVQEATQKAADIITGGSFNFDPDTPGYENFLKLRSGGPPKDGIPSIDNPKFESVSSADSWLNDSDVVFAVNQKGEVKAYPQRILDWHEIVNDEVGGDPLAVTYCPLCGSALSFERTVDTQVTEFGVSGLLHNNDLVMYDRQTESLWQQITGEAIVGEQFGKRLKQVPTSGMLWSQFKKEFPEGRVLSRETGFSRDYDVSPYAGYEQSPDTLFPMEVDRTIHPKTVVYGLEVNGKFKAYPEDKLANEGTVRDNVGGEPIELTYRNGEVEARNTQTQEELVATRLFWFAWKAFRPETELY